jgi:hypothetical protein
LKRKKELFVRLFEKIMNKSEKNHIVKKISQVFDTFGSKIVYNSTSYKRRKI